MRSIGIKHVLSHVLFLSYLVSWAQQPYALKLQHNSDLPDHTIYNIYQDKKGFVWIACNEGILRYDGFRYTVYRSEKQTSVAGSNITEDKYGRIWYQNFDGYLYYVAAGRLQHLDQNPPPGFVCYGITDRYLFVAQKKGVDIYDLESLQLVKTIPILLDIVEHATVMQQNYYLISDDIIYQIDEHFKLSSSIFFIDKDLHVKYIQAYKNKLYIVSKRNEQRQLYFFDHKLEFLNTIPIPDFSQIQGSDVLDGHIWLHTPQGVCAIDERGNIIHQSLFPDNSSSKVIKDYQHNYWFSSINNGIYIVPDLKNKMYDTRPFFLTTSAHTPQGYLLGTKTGELMNVDKQFNTRKRIYSNTEQLPIYYLHYDQQDKHIILSDNGFSIIQEKNGKKKHFNIALKEAIRIDHKYYAIAASGFFGLLLNPDADEHRSSVWDDLFYQHRDKTEPQIALIKKGLRAKSVTFMSKKHQLLFATNIGTYIVHPEAEHELKREGAAFYCSKILNFENKAFFLDTKGNLYRLSPDNNLQNLNTLWEIPAGTIRKIKRSDGELLVLGSTSLYTFSGTKLKKTDLSVKNSSIRDFWIEDKAIFVLTDDQLLKFYQKTNSTKKNIRFYVDSLLVNQRAVKWQIPQKLNYDERNISILFSSLDFIDKDIDMYYRINTKEWIPINNETRTLEFPSLSAGSYLLEFKVCDAISDQKIQFEIMLPFWKKWWFYLLCSLSLGVLIFFYYQHQSKLMQQQITLLDEKVALEKSLGKSVLVSIKSQMNPHFFYNALNTIQAYIFTNDRKRASNYLSKFSKLTRIILEMSERETVSIQEEITAIGLYLDLEKMRFSDNFTYDISVEAGIDKDLIEFPPMLLQPYIENAVKHGLLHQEGEKNLQISFTKKEDSLYVTIIDSGIGRKRSADLHAIKDKTHRPFSTQANERRLEILNRGQVDKITVEITDRFDADGKPSGTTVFLQIPIKEHV